MATVSENKKIKTVQFTVAYFLFSLLWMGGLAVVIAVLLPQHLREVVGVKNSTAIFGIFNAASAVTSLLSNLIVGNLSDRTRSRFGQRTPWIIAGGIVAGLSLFLVGVFQNVWLMGISYCFSMIGLNMMIAPAMATLSDRVPETIRATTSALFSAGTTVGTSVGTLIGAKFISSQIPGFVTAGLMMGIAGIATVIVWPKESSAKTLPPWQLGLKSYSYHFVHHFTVLEIFG
ncbi:MAG: MFS transporter [Leuconostoc citreum]